jgi:hypothetical protein
MKECRLSINFPRAVGQKENSMSKKSKATSHTGRDGYIMGQALVYAIAHIQGLPEEKQEFSNMCDMCTIAREAGFSVFLSSHVTSVFAHTGVKVNLWPEREPTDERGIAQREAINASFEAWQEFVARCKLEDDQREAA